MKLMISELPKEDKLCSILIRFPEDLMEQYTPALEKLDKEHEFLVTNTFQSKDIGIISCGVLFFEHQFDSVDVKRIIQKAFGLL